MIHRKRLDTGKLPFNARRVDHNTDFVTSTDTWFRPVQFDNGPDGALYVADFYRETIEHPASLPESIKKHLDLTSGRDRGRIYRIVPEGFQHRPTPKLGEASTAEFVGYLAHTNAWHRETAARLLYERQDKTAIPLLTEMASRYETSDAEAAGGGALSLARVHALWALEGLDALSDDVLADAMLRSSSRVRENAIKLARPRLARSSELRQRLFGLAQTADPWVRYEAAFALGEVMYAKDVPKDDKQKAIDELAVLALGYLGYVDWIPMAALSSLSGHEADVMATYQAANYPTPVWQEFAAIVARRAKSDRSRARRRSGRKAAGFRNGESDARRVVRCAESRRPRCAERASRPRLKEVFASRLAHARRVVKEDDAADDAKIAALKTFRLAPFGDSEVAFLDLAGGRHSPAVQRAAVELLSGYDDASVASLLIEAWPRLSPAVRESVAAVLTSTAERAGALLDAVAAQEFDAGALPQASRQLLQQHPNRDIRLRTAELLASSALSKRDDVVQDYRRALEINGNVARGRGLFEKHCAACHKLGGIGHEVGPNLAAIKSRGAEFILLNVLDPSREVNPQFVNYTLVTTNGEVKTGMIASESPTAVALKRSEGATETVLRLDIDELQSTGQSLMPDGFEKQLDPQALADVIAFLMSLE